MSLHEYLCSQAIHEGDPPFYALLFALMRAADSGNAAKLRALFPDEWEELQARYDAPGGLLPTDQYDPEVLQHKRVLWNGKIVDMRKVNPDPPVELLPGERFVRPSAKERSGGR